MQKIFAFFLFLNLADAISRVSKSNQPQMISGTVTVGNGKQDESPIFDFVFGLILILFAIPMIWFNERKLVRMYKLFEKARKAVVPDIAINEVRGVDNLRLIHAVGKTTTSETLTDG